MKNFLQHIRNYLLPGLILTVLLISAKILLEQTSVGLRPELFVFQALQAIGSALNSREDLPVAVLDISSIESKDGQVMNLQKLREIISALAEQRPCAIAIHVALNPEDNPSINQENPGQNKIQQSKDYYDFLDFCVKLKAEKNIPIFLSVSKQKETGLVADWLGREEYKELAVIRRIREEDTTRVPIWLKADAKAEKLFSLSASLARAHASPRLSNKISWLVETTDGLPGKLKYLEEGIQYSDAPVSYSKLEVIRQNKISLTDDKPIKEARENFYHKMVLLGDATLKKGQRGYSVPWRSEEIPGVYLQACAAYTFACKPLYELTFIGRLSLDICLSLLVFGGVAITRYRHSGNKRTWPVRQQQGGFIHIIEGVVLLLVIISVYWLGLLWLDFLLVAIALWLHPRFEKLVVRVSTYRPGFADNEFALIGQEKENPTSETESLVCSNKRKILFISANPINEFHTQTDREHSIIRAEIERGSHRDVFEFLQPQFGTTITQLLRAMNSKPNIVHFSGHGAAEGIKIAKDNNESQLLNTEALGRLFEPLKNCTEIVVLNSCYSASQAEFISKFGMYVVGSNLPIEDNASLSFAKGLYNGLGEGKSFEAAVNDARIVVLAESPAYSSCIEVWKSGNRLNI
jgi:hypothetical protein